MREIKFRAWDKYTQEIRYNTNSRIFDNYEEEDIMQYTGLRDKNGKKIYEGDIVNHGDNYPSVVIWDDDYYWLDGPGFCLKETNNKNGIRYHSLPYLTTPIEVLGNIYENPELLTKQSEVRNIN